MSDATTETSESPFAPPPSEAGSFGSGPSPAEADRAAHAAQDDGTRPEIVAAGAFVGAFVFAQVLKRLGGGS